jgi:2-methylisocitrate lyase-like PEP mutase family enzyme
MSRQFHALHDELLVLPNAWDVASARLLGRRFPAVGTTSLGVAAAAGLPDGIGAARGATLELARRLRDRPFLLSADLEGGFDGVEDYVAELGADGINIEDGRPGPALAPVEEQCAHVAAIKARTPDVFVNARTDTHWLGVAREETVGRVRAYVEAGADGVFVPGLPEDLIAEVAGAARVPLNVLARSGGPSLARLAELGVRRVSTGSLLYRLALGHAVHAAAELRATGGVDGAAALGYAEVDGLAAAGPRERPRADFSSSPGPPPPLPTERKPS